MKKIILLSLLFVIELNITISSQIGIFTNSPRQLFEVYPVNGGSPILSITTEGKVGIYNNNPTLELEGSNSKDILMAADKHYITSGSTPTSYSASSSIESAYSNMGILINRVALTYINTKSPVTNATQGMLVYNTTNLPTRGLTPGYYFWNGSYWEKPLNKRIINEPRNFPLTKGVTSSIAVYPSDTEQTQDMSFGNILLSNGNYGFKIDEAGNYAFAIKVRGFCSMVEGRNQGRACIYFTLMVNGVKTDVQEINWMISDYTDYGAAQMGVGGTALLVGADLKVGDLITFKLGRYIPTWTVSLNLSGGYNSTSQTSLQYWRL